MVTSVGSQDRSRRPSSARGNGRTLRGCELDRGGVPGGRLAGAPHRPSLATVHARRRTASRADHVRARTATSCASRSTTSRSRRSTSPGCATSATSRGSRSSPTSTTTTGRGSGGSGPTASPASCPTAEHEPALDALAAKYPQYREVRPRVRSSRCGSCGWSGWACRSDPAWLSQASGTVAGVLHVSAADALEVLADELAGVLAIPLADPMQAEWIAAPSQGMARLAADPARPFARIVGTAAAPTVWPPTSTSASPARCARRCSPPDGRPTSPIRWEIDRLVWSVLAVLHDAPRRRARSRTSPRSRRARPGTAARDGSPTCSTATRVHRPAMVRAWARGSDVDGAGKPIADSAAWQPHLWRLVRERVGRAEPRRSSSPSSSTASRAGDLALDLPPRLSFFGLTTLPGGAPFLDLVTAVGDPPRRAPLPLLPVAGHGRDRARRRSGPAAVSDELLRADDPSIELVGHPLVRSWARPNREAVALLAAAEARGTIPAAIGRGLRRSSDRLAARAAPGRSPRRHRAGRRLRCRPTTTGRSRSTPRTGRAGRSRCSATRSCTGSPTIRRCAKTRSSSCARRSTRSPRSSRRCSGRPRAGAPATPRRRPGAARSRTASPTGRCATPTGCSARSRRSSISSRDGSRRRPCSTSSRSRRCDSGSTSTTTTSTPSRAGPPRPRSGGASTAPTAARGASPATTPPGRGARCSTDSSSVSRSATTASRSRPATCSRSSVEGSGVPVAGRLADVLARLADLRRGGLRAADRGRVVRRARRGRRRVPRRAGRRAVAGGRAGAAAAGHRRPRRTGDRRRAHPGRRPSPAWPNTSAASRGVPTSSAGESRCRRSRRCAAFRSGSCASSGWTTARSARRVPTATISSRRPPHLGDRDARAETRQALLEAVLAAGESLVVTRTGSNVVTNQTVPPSVPLVELRDALLATVSPARGEAIGDRLEIEHPRQAFDVRNFTRGSVGRRRSVELRPDRARGRDRPRR